jgi:hypothetical protein
MQHIADNIGATDKGITIADRITGDVGIQRTGHGLWSWCFSCKHKVKSATKQP